MKRLIILIVVVFIAGCSNAHFFGSKTKKQVPVSTLAPKITTKHCKLKPFRSIMVGGDAEVELVSGPYAIDIKGTHLDKYDCQNIIDQTLYIGNVGTNIYAKVSAPKLEKITVINDALVRAKEFKTGGLTIVAKCRGAIDLQGEFNINSIMQYGEGKIDVDWINDNSLYVESYNSGPICLAGRADRMIVKLVNGARLFSRYLRVREASVFTADKALAEVLVFDTLGAYAIDASNIFYYRQPKDITVVTRDSGNVLYPEWVR